MNDYLEIFSDVVLLATFQPRWSERIDPIRRLGESSRSRPKLVTASGRHVEGPERR